MKFMTSWTIDQDKWIPILQKWAAMTPEQRADAGHGVTLIGRWHDTASRRGVAIVEASDLTALNRFIGQWNPFMDIEIAPVLDDEESAAAAGLILSDHGG